MGVEILYRRLERGFDGFTVSATTIVVNSLTTGRNRGLTIAHELGHVAVRRGNYRPRSVADEETFADAYGAQVIAAG
jgi:Zn-dependent peptidase ImmA (M78 family)